jgi:hypothetical protein
MAPNFLLIYISIFCFGVSAGLVLSSMLENRKLHKSRKKTIWKA